MSGRTERAILVCAIIICAILLILLGVSRLDAASWVSPHEVFGDAPPYTNEVSFYCDEQEVGRAHVFVITHGGWYSGFPPDWVYWLLIEDGCEAGDMITARYDGRPAAGGVIFEPEGRTYFDIVDGVTDTTWLPLVMGGD